MENINIRQINKDEKDTIRTIANIHVNTFQGFFLTFLGEGFLNQLYRGYCEHQSSGLIAAFAGCDVIGFLAYSNDLSGLYKHLIKKRLLMFAWYSLLAFFRNPKSLFRLLKAFLKPSESKRDEKFTELASIGVSPEYKGKGVGTLLINHLKHITDFKNVSYITLETDAQNNEYANLFYVRNGFELYRTYVTDEGRVMNEYRCGGGIFAEQQEEKDDKRIICQQTVLSV